MFQMMNGARIDVGLAAANIASAAYYASLDYAKERPQGRPLPPRILPPPRCRLSGIPISNGCSCFKRQSWKGLSLFYCSAPIITIWKKLLKARS